MTSLHRTNMHYNNILLVGFDNDYTLARVTYFKLDVERNGRIVQHERSSILDGLRRSLPSPRIHIRHRCIHDHRFSITMIHDYKSTAYLSKKRGGSFLHFYYTHQLTVVFSISEIGVGLSRRCNTLLRTSRTRQ